MKSNISYKLLSALFLVKRLNNTDPQSHYTLPQDLYASFVGNNYKTLISRLKSSNLIDIYLPVYKKNDSKSLSLTYLGENKLLAHFANLNFWASSWDKFFHLVILSVPEAKRKIRDHLRYSLKSLFFGQINRSLYITPYFTSKEISHLIARYSEIDDLRFQIIKLPWQSFEEVGFATLSDYWQLYTVADIYEKALARYQINGDKGLFLNKFMDGFLNDPFLPSELLPDDFPGREALEIAKSILRP